jgi:hypothetical protein
MVDRIIASLYDILNSIEEIESFFNGGTMEFSN